MQPVFNRQGKTVAWLNENTVYDLTGIARALLKNDEVLAVGGRHLGFVRDGYFRDRLGHAVAFLPSAKGQPALPQTENPPPPPDLAPLPSFLPAVEVTTNSRAVSPYWSPFDWNAYLKG